MSVAAPARVRERARSVNLPRAAPLIFPLGLAAGSAWLTFANGGFFAGTTAIAVVVAGVACLLWLMLTARPLAALTLPLGVSVGALTLFTLWTLVSQAWSHAAARAVLESDRALLYVLVVALFGLAAAAPLVRRALPMAVAAPLAGASICALITRVLPDVWPTPADIDFDRLSYPTSYWNAQGLIAALAVVACVHLTSSARERIVVRALAAAATPLVAAALFFTFSRGAILVTPVGLVALLALARPGRIVSAAAALVPTTAIALVACYRADTLSDAVRPTPALVSEGHTVALVLAGCALAAAAIVVLARGVDARAQRWPRPSRGQARALIAVAAVALVVVGYAAHVPQKVADRIGSLDTTKSVAAGDGNRQRLTDLADSGRVEQWRVALDAFSAHPAIGNGAGTFAVLWARDRHTDQEVTDGHSLYLEALAELGVVGLALIVAALGALLIGTARRALGRDGDRPLAAVAFALTLMWALHAGIDWDWEMPATAVPVLALAAAGLVRPGRAASEGGVWPARLPRLLAGIALLGLLVTPVAIARSQARLNTAMADMRVNRCPQAVSAALASTSALSIRPEPFQVLALCDARLGRADLGLAAIEAGVRRDPQSWQLRYDLAILRAVRGLDPRPELQQARRLNPRSVLVADALKRFSTNDPAAWRRAALTAPISI